MDDEAVLVDEAALDELPGDVRAAHVDLAVELVAELREHVADVAVDEPAAEVDRSSVRENTNLGCSLQISPYWRIAGVAFGSLPAVGQYAVITSYIRRP